jgi:hypothetical protein
MSYKIVNPQVSRLADLMTDGTITDLMLRDVAVMYNLPLHIECSDDIYTEEYRIARDYYLGAIESYEFSRGMVDALENAIANNESWIAFRGGKYNVNANIKYWKESLKIKKKFYLEYKEKFESITKS